MTENVPNALKHGAFSEILILPGENQEEFDKLKDELFEEYKPSGVSEQRAMMAIAKALWQERRLTLYQYVQRARAGLEVGHKRDPYAMEKAIAKARRIEFVPPVETPRSAAQLIDDELLQLGKLLTLDQLNKELDVEAKMQAKIDKLFKRFFQIRAMKQITAVAEAKPVADSAVFRRLVA